MSATFDAAFDALVSDLAAEYDTPTTPEEPVVIDAQSKTRALSTLVEHSATTAAAGEAAAAGVAGYEASYAAMIGAFANALRAGVREADIRRALQADCKESGTIHVGASADACQTLSALAALADLPGDLPEGWVYRAAQKGMAGLMEGEQSLTTLVRAVRAPADSALLRGEGHGDLYGKARVTAIIAEASTKVDAITALLAARAEIAAILKDLKKGESPAKDALKYLKAASGPLGKVAEALDAGRLGGDAAEVATVLDALAALIEEAKAHAALTLTSE